jgi:hypothetical protein
VFTPSELCREQAAIQRALAGSSTLQNVRDRAVAAAKAWEAQAVLAEARDRRKSQNVDSPFRSTQDWDVGLSENPDRGLAPA